MKPVQIFAAVMILIGVLVYFSHQDMLLIGDGQLRYNALADLIERHRFTSTPYSMVMPLCALPLYLLGRLVGSAAGGVAFFSLLTTLIFLPLFWRALRELADQETATLTCILLLGNSMVLAYTPYFFAEPFNLTLVGMAIVWYRTGRNGLAAGALVLSAANIPATLVATGLLCLRWTWNQGRLRWLCLPILAALEFGLECWLFRAGSSSLDMHTSRHISILPYSHTAIAFVYPWLLGLMYLLFSFGKGMLFFCPGLLLSWWVRPRLRESERCTLDDMYVYLFGVLLVYAHWTGWDGGDCWGPRFLLFASLPTSLLLAVALREKARSLGGLLLSLMVLAWSAWVGIDGAVYNLFGLESFYWGKQEPWYFATYATTEFSPLFHPFVQGLMDIESPVRALVFFFFLLGNLALALPLFQQLVDRVLEWEYPKIEWKF